MIGLNAAKRSLNNEKHYSGESEGGTGSSAGGTGNNSGLFTQSRRISTVKTTFETKSSNAERSFVRYCLIKSRTFSKNQQKPRGLPSYD